MLEEPRSDLVNRKPKIKSTVLSHAATYITVTVLLGQYLAQLKVTFTDEFFAYSKFFCRKLVKILIDAFCNGVRGYNDFFPA